MGKGTHPGCAISAQQGTSPSPQGREGHWLYGVLGMEQEGPCLLCQASPVPSLCSHITEGRRPMGLFLQPCPHLPFAFTDAHSLCYNFTVDSQPRPGQPRCVVQSQVDGNVFLFCDCGRAKIQFTIPLGEEVKRQRPGKHRLKHSETSGTCSGSSCLMLRWRTTGSQVS